MAEQLDSDLQLSQRAALRAARPRCTIIPYLPYVAMALRPVFELAVLGVVVLAIASIEFGTASQIVHVAASFVFFYGMTVLSGLWVFFQGRMTTIFPLNSKVNLGLDPASMRYRVHVHLFWAKISVLLILNWIIPVVGACLEYFRDSKGLLHAVCVAPCSSCGGVRHAAISNLTSLFLTVPCRYQYIAGISQYTLVLLLVATVMTFARDMDALPDDEWAKALHRSGPIEDLGHVGVEEDQEGRCAL